jgi:hypothetical protein
LLGYRRDALLEIDGKLQPVKAHKDAPAGLVMRVLETAFKDWRPGVTQNINLNGQVAVGIGFQPKQTYQGPPPPVLAEPAIPQIEDQSDSDVTDVEFEEVPEAAQAAVVIAPTISVVEPQPVVIRDTEPGPEPMAFAAMPQRAPRNALEADLFEKLAEARNKPKL